jgi:hypothetical protein
MVIYVVDDSAHLICLERMDGTQIGSVIVRRKRPQRRCGLNVHQSAGGRRGRWPLVVMKLPGRYSH